MNWQMVTACAAALNVLGVGLGYLLALRIRAELAQFRLDMQQWVGDNYLPRETAGAVAKGWEQRLERLEQAAAA